MLEKTSKKFRTLFLLKFTEELIRNSNDIEIIRLEELLSRKGKINDLERGDIKKEVQQKLQGKVFVPKGELKADPFSKSLEVVKKRPPRTLSLPISRGPIFRPKKAPTLPSTVSDIKPVANTNVLIDLGKLMPLTNDPNVKMIEVEGENQKVIVQGPMGRKPSSITLTKEEINQIIDNFSKEAKIPKSDGLFKVAVGSLMLTSMISESVGSRFIIKKLENNNPPIAPGFNQ